MNDSVNPFPTVSPSPVNSQAPMVVTTLCYRGADIRFVQRPQEAPATRQHPRAYLIIDDEILDGLGFKKPFRKIIHGMVALSQVGDPETGQDNPTPCSFYREDILIQGDKVDVVSYDVLSYLSERYGRMAKEGKKRQDPALMEFIEWCFTAAWEILTGQCVCSTYSELDENGEVPVPQLERTSVSAGIETLSQAIQKIEQLALEKSALVKAIEDAYRMVVAA